MIKPKTSKLQYVMTKVIYDQTSKLQNVMTKGMKQITKYVVAGLFHIFNRVKNMYMYDPVRMYIKRFNAETR